KIVGQLLVDHALGYALTATTNVPDVYLQQFWKTVKQVPNANEIIRFMVNKEEITYTVDMFCAKLTTPVRAFAISSLGPRKGISRAAELSQNIQIGSFIVGTIPSPEINFLIQTASIAAFEAATYSASVADIVVVLCLELFQSTVPPFKMKTYHV
nr:hypothetical protein [Tanacetum cinerariifolium]